MEVHGQVDMLAALISETVEYKLGGGGNRVLEEVVVKRRKLSIPAESANPTMHPANSHLTQLNLLYCQIQQEFSAY